MLNKPAISPVLRDTDPGQNPGAMKWVINPGNYPVGSLESRAAARAFAASRHDPQPAYRIIFDVPWVGNRPSQAPQRWRDSKGRLVELVFENWQQGALACTCPETPSLERLQVAVNQCAEIEKQRAQNETLVGKHSIGG